ncbi:MAG TPA: PASTA domain-containing protein, partial [Burkholderiaceae bacterium]|nr:PASTA domain-containing protein [Burkholderiaceae bacterium]
QKLPVPAVIGRNDSDVGSALAEFKVDRVQVPSAAAAGEVLAQDPAPAALAVPGSTVTLQVSDGSLAAAASKGTASTGANETAPAQVPAAVAVPTPAPIVASVMPAPRTSEDATRGFAMLSTNGALVLIAGVSLGLILGALLMRQWQLRRSSAADEIVTAPAPYQEQSVDRISVTPPLDVTGEVRFAARRDPSETTIEFVAFADDEAVSIEQSSEQHG